MIENLIRSIKRKNGTVNMYGTVHMYGTIHMYGIVYVTVHNTVNIDESMT